MCFLSLHHTSSLVIGKQCTPCHASLCRDDSAAVKAETKALTDWIRDYVKPGDDPVEPMSDIYYPIVDGIEKGLVVGAEGYYPTNHSVVGMITASFYWREFIRDVLPPGTEGVVIVIDSPCNDPFTYELMGPNVKYLGVGDNHDPKYDRLGVHSKLIDLTEFSSKNSTYSGARLDEEFCPYTLHVYPSDALKSESTSTMPVVLTVSAVIIFIFTSFVFCFYDLAVERRQKLVMKNATRSSEIVSSLFPSTVRDQLYQAEDEAGAKRNKGNAFSSEESKVPLQLFGLGGTIAELYPETTVMFADIAGFTAWSSVRQPCQVFHLLESLYGAFDQIAKQRGVFKVETIGDSYVAVVGLPTPRKQHAVVMVRFAKDCRNKMNELTRELEITLGPVSYCSCAFAAVAVPSLIFAYLSCFRQGTAELSLRLGLNSGPTTAGVLRGEKSRFQLFGDVSSSRCPELLQRCGAF